MDQFKQHGIIARFGGEEFILLINNVSQQELYQIAEHIRYTCESCIVKCGDNQITFTISIGCCHQTQINTTLKAILKKLISVYMSQNEMERTVYKCKDGN